MSNSRLVTEDKLVNLELTEHIRVCQTCASHVAAEKILRRAINLERDRMPEAETPIAFLKTRLEARASRQAKKEHAVMTSLKNRFLSHPIMSFGFLGAFVLLVAMATVPVSCSRSVGYAVDVADDDTIASAISSDAAGTASITFQRNADGSSRLAELDPRKVVEALSALGISNAKLEVSAGENGRTFNISGLKSREQARDALLAIVEVAGLGGKAQIKTRTGEVTCSLLEHCVNGLEDIIVDSDGLSDDQVRSQIVAELEAAGCIGAEVQFMTGSEGQKMIFIGSGGECDSTIMQEELQWMMDSNCTDMMLNGADTTVIYDIQADGDNQTIEVQKRITVDSDR